MSLWFCTACGLDIRAACGLDVRAVCDLGVLQAVCGLAVSAMCGSGGAVIKVAHAEAKMNLATTDLIGRRRTPRAQSTCGGAVIRKLAPPNL